MVRPQADVRVVLILNNTVDLYHSLLVRTVIPLNSLRMPLRDIQVGLLTQHVIENFLQQDMLSHFEKPVSIRHHMLEPFR